MEAVEVDVALEELEIRLERLRALYEQYFMGIEKIEPSIARKDVDRRIYVLRREKIRNTAKRFKLQTIIQRYNTFQQYWQRICREIENGTYKRHLLKAQKQQGELLTIAARKRLGRQAITSNRPPAAAESQPPNAPASVPAPASAPAPAVAAAPSPAPSAAAAAAPLPQAPARLAPPPKPGQRAPAPAALAAAAPMPPPAAAPATPVRLAAVAPIEAPTTAAPKSPPAPKYESLDLDMDFMGDWDPGSRTKAAPAKPAAAPAKPAALAKPPLLQSPPAQGPAPAPSPPKAPLQAAPPANRPASIPPAAVAAPPRPASSRPPTAPARPIVRPAAPAPKPAAAAPKPAPAPVAAASGAGVDDARMRDLHSRLQQAKEQTKEAGVSYEGLAKSIRATEAKLREQHKNRKIDFDVVIKDGKAVVKPIVR